MLFDTWILVLITIVPAYARLDIEGYKIYRINSEDETQLNAVQNMIRSGYLQKEFNIDVWNFPSAVNQRATFRIPNYATANFEAKMRAEGINLDTDIDDIQRFLDEEQRDNPPDDAFAGWQENFPIDAYHTYEAISAFIDATASRYSDIATVLEIGTTFEGNPIKGLKIGSQSSNKPAIWIDGGIHAAEWMGSAVIIYIIDNLIKGYTLESTDEIRNLVDTFDWYLIPVINVDGYIYTWTTDRIWRKNRVPNFSEFDNDGYCFGVDVNRNFAAGFGDKGSKLEPCSSFFHGPYPFSEAESRAVRDGVLALKDSLKGYINLHSFSQRVMIPYGYTNETSPDYNDQIRAVAAMSEKMRNTHSVTYKYGTISSTIYSASGTAIDWVYDGAQVKYSITIELRDTGERGFLVPKDQIVPNAEELFAGIKELTNIIRSEM